MKKSMLEIASLLDETIEKGRKANEIDQLSLSELVRSYRRSVKSGVKEDLTLLSKAIFRKKGGDLRKSISFNPLDLHVMSADSGYHSPYMMLEDGSFAPHSAKHWMDQSPFPHGESGVGGPRFPTAMEEMIRRDGYGEVDRFLQAAGVNKAELYSEIDSIVKAAKIPHGTTHEWGGHKFKKEKTGWTPVDDQGKPKDHPVELDLQHKHKTLSKIVEGRKKGKLKEPTFEDRTKIATKRHQELSDKESELDERERSSADRDLKHRESEVSKKEEKLKPGTKSKAFKRKSTPRGAKK